jgi:hypothetical protein
LGGFVVEGDAAVAGWDIVLSLTISQACSNEIFVMVGLALAGGKIGPGSLSHCLRPGGNFTPQTVPVFW